MRRPDDDAERSPNDSGVAATSRASVEIVHEVHEPVDRFGDLQQDLDALEHDRDDEVWFDPDELAASSKVDLGADLAVVDHLVRAPSIERLASMLGDPGISLAQLPGWPDAGPSGQGLGELATELIGELRPGDVIVVGGARGSGRTSLLAQLGDGLALLDRPDRPATPVVFVSAAGPSLWRARTLARYFGVDARTFLDPGHARAEPRLAAMLSEFAQGPWAELDDRQRFVGHTALDPNSDRRTATVTALRRFLVEQRERVGRSVWPIVIVDPLLSIDRLPDLAALAADEGWILWVSGELDADPSHARAIDLHASVRLRLAAVDDHTLALELWHRRLGPRGRGQLEWQPASGRLRPATGSRPRV